MAIDTYLGCKIDPSAAKRVDAADCVHLVTRQTANYGDLTVAFDRTKVGSVTVLKSALAQVIKAAAGGNELTA